MGVCGPEHHYERSHPIRGRESNAALTPVPVATATDVIDTSKGTVHMVIGGGGTSAPSDHLVFNPPPGPGITARRGPHPPTGTPPPHFMNEPPPCAPLLQPPPSHSLAALPA